MFFFQEAMCGIWAYINDDNSKAACTEEDFFRSFWNLRRRGPDNSHLETFDNVYVGFHRLAVMDKSFKSNQPYVLMDTDGSCVVFICNGEIYNYKELNKKYDLDVGTSDCLVIPKLYMKLGAEHWRTLFNSEIKGEFAFCLFHFDHMKKLREYHVGRDRVGVRPLYEGSDGVQIFSSLIIGVPNKVSVQEFQPGTIKSVECNNFSSRTNIYEFNKHFGSVDLGLKPEDYSEHIRTSVYNSIERRLNADRPIAFLLSGGVDSSLVCAISSRILGQNIRTFCCGIEGSTDMIYAKKVAEHIGSNHTEIYFTEEEGLHAIGHVILTTETWDVTTIRASVGQYLVSKYISKNTDCKVVLVGEGPDEVCSSYLFNYYAPSADALQHAAVEYVNKIHLFDGRRADRCVSHWGLECRVPFLDPEFISAYWNIPAEERMPIASSESGEGRCEKYELRKAFSGYDLLPEDVLWRKKEAFSDGVSSKKRSWYQVIEEYIQTRFGMSEKDYYLHCFKNFFGENRLSVLPHYWQPKWNEKQEEIECYVDPSARTLGVYENNT